MSGKPSEIIFPLSPEEEARFWKRIQVSENPEACWLWTAGKDGKGYGRFYLQGAHRGAHIVSYRMHKSDYDPSRQVGHLCGNESCCNPAHLEMQTMLKNLQDRNILVAGTRKTDAEYKRQSRERNERSQKASKFVEKSFAALVSAFNELADLVVSPLIGLPVTEHREGPDLDLVEA